MANTHPHHPIVLFDDSDGRGDGSDGAPLLSPLTDLRSVFDVRTGALTTLERLIRVLGDGSSVRLRVPDRLAVLTRERHPERSVNAHGGTGGLDAASRVLLINGRCPLIAGALLTEWSGLALGRAHRSADGAVVAAMVDAHTASAFLTTGRLPDLVSADLQTTPSPRLLTRPWHVRTFRDAALSIDLALLAEAIHSGRIPEHATTFGSHPVRVHATATLLPGVVIDASAGAVIIDEHATVRPGAIIAGPCYVGSHATVMDRAVIRPQTAIGPHCKVGGEVGGTIFQGLANKAHDGYLGDSYVGEWVNLGANTTNSNLLNTYGEIVSRPLRAARGPAGSNERTGETFLGCVLGDHVKTAIGTRIMTGSVVGTGTMFAAGQPLTGTVPGFRWVTDATPLSATSAGADYRLEKMLDVARAAMARRRIAPTEAYVEALRSLTTS